MRTRSWIALAMLLVMAPMSRAAPDAMAALKATLAGLDGSGPVQATLQLERTATTGDDEKTTTHAELKYGFRVDGDGLRVTYPAALMHKVAAESRAHAADASASTPVQDLLGSYGAEWLAERVDYAPVLGESLAHATLTDQAHVKRAGKPTTLLQFDVPHGPLSNEDSLDEYKGTLKVWLDDKGMPVAARQYRHFKFSKFFIKFTVTVSAEMELAHVGNRLVMTSMVSKRTNGGYGDDGDTTTRVTLDVTAVDKRPASQAPASASSTAT